MGIIDVQIRINAFKIQHKRSPKVMYISIDTYYELQQTSGVDLVDGKFDEIPVLVCGEWFEGDIELL